jgi:hypothetical protein
MNNNNATDKIQGKTKSGLHIAVIDDGVNEGIFDVGELTHSLEITII